MLPTLKMPRSRRRKSEYAHRRQRVKRSALAKGELAEIYAAVKAAHQRMQLDPYKGWRFGNQR